MCEKIFNQSFAGIVFKIEVIERGKITDKVVLRNSNELLHFTQKICGAE